MKPVSEEIRFQRILSQLSEFFPDYFVAIRIQGGVRWHASSQEWALGAAERYKTRKNAEDATEAMAMMRPDQEDTDDER